MTNGYLLDKAAIERCWKLDSFLKESQRLNGLGAREPFTVHAIAYANMNTPVSLPRLTLAPYAFSDGTVIPAGTLVAAAPTATHVDPEFFENPETFDGLRFYKFRKMPMNRRGQISVNKHCWRISGFRRRKTCLVS